MSDFETQVKRREALMDPSKRVRDRTRTRTRVGYYRSFVGQKIYYQGLRMNYIGTLCDVLCDSLGEPTELLFSSLTYVGDWNQEGPNENYCMEMPCTEEHPASLLVGAEQISLCPWK